MKETIQFTGLEVETSKLFNLSRKIKGACPETWTRVMLIIPPLSNYALIDKWIDVNLTGKYYSYHYDRSLTHSSKKEKLTGMCIVYRFEHKNDALMFKLMGGNQAYLDEYE